MEIKFSQCLCRARHQMLIATRMPLLVPLFRSINSTTSANYKTKNDNDDAEKLRIVSQNSLSCKADKLSRLCDNVRRVSSCKSSLRRFHGDSCDNSANNTWNSLHYAKRGIVVETNETPNPDCLRFFSMELSFLKPEFSIDIPSPEHAYKSPLAMYLFGVEGIVAVFIADEYITVRKAPDASWEELIPLVQETIIEFVSSNQNVLTPEGEEELQGYNDDTEPEEGDDEVVLAVKELLATRIRPMLRADGGNVRYIDMDDGTVFLLLEGACKACPSSHITLKSGIERMLMHWIPEVCEAQEVTDEIAKDILAEKKLRKKMKEQNEVIKALEKIVTPNT